MKIPARSAAMLLASALFLAACGGSGTSTNTTAAGGTISGSVVLGPVAGATVRAYAVTGGAMGAQLGSGTTDSSGNFTLAIGHYAGPMMLQASSGSYTDEATGATMAVQPGDVLTGAVPSLDADVATTGVHVTPLTSMARARAAAMTGGMTAANIMAANSGVGAYFSVSDILRTTPMDPTAAASGTTPTQDERNYGMVLAAMSQEAASLGMTSSSGMATAMADDASDGVMDGMMASTSISMSGMGGMGGGMMQANAGTSGLATAMATFIGSGMNRSGVTAADMQALMTQLSGSSGVLQGTGGGSAPGGVVSGRAFMGAMTGGTMTAYSVSNGAVGPTMGTATMDPSGAFTISVGSYSGPMMLQLTGGTFRDEATGTSMAMQAGDVLTAVIPSVAAGASTTGVLVTPLTSMAQAAAQGMSGGMTEANIGAANAGVGSYFMVGDILATTPMDPSAPGAGTGATQDQRDYGMSIAAISQYAASVGMTDSSAMVTALVKDASDGVMNGMTGTTPISMGGMGGGMMGGGGTMMTTTAGTTGLAGALTAFAGSFANRSGVALADMQPLVTQLGTSSGVIP